MKKAKIMLSAVGLLSLIGGALAFKAQHRQNPQWYCTSISTATCSIKSYTTVDPTTSLYCSTITRKTCPLTRVAFAD